MIIKLSNSCGSCIHTNKPKKPREHAAHYEVAKTERWCFKHNRNVSRECTCDDHEGYNRSAKTSFTRIINYNQRQDDIFDIIKLMNNKPVFDYDKIFFVKNNWLFYVYGNDISKITNDSYHYAVMTKNGSTDKYLKSIKLILIKNERNY
jgi:hypothetical protein